MSYTPSVAETTLAGTRSPSPLGEKILDNEALAHSLSKIPEKHDALSDPEKATEKPASHNSDSARTIHGFQWFLVCISLYLSAFMYGLDTTIAADVQAAVVSTFGNVEQLTWMGAGFPLGSVATVLPIGALYGKFNQKWIYIGSLVLFEAGSALCGGAPNMDALIVGRVIAGMGGSGIYLGVLNYLSMTTTESERGTYIALTGVVWGAGCILGPVIGGAFSVSNATWRWAFYINLVIAAVSAPVYFLYLPALRLMPGVSSLKKLTHIDWVGFVLSAGFWVAFTMVLTFAGGAWPWKDARTIVLFIVFGILLTTFALQQYFNVFTTADNRMFPHHLLSSRTQILLYFGTAAAVTGLFIPVYYIPIYFQFVQNDTALMAAVRLLPFVLIAISANMLTGALLPKVGYYMPIYAGSGVFMLIGGALMYTITADSPIAHIYGYSILIALGSGPTLQTGYAVATVKVAPKDISNAISLQNVAQIGSIVISLVISGQVFQSYAYNNLVVALAGHGFSDAELHSAVAGSQSAVFTTISPELKHVAVEAITTAMSKVYILVITAGAVTLVSSLFMRREKLFLQIVAGG
ncbi:hypothetical protein MMC19_005653 [Ptychographa xylographoides]|nr:hypothetical protein [Ptychographa xylographoides]